jgi:hypothetical protein
VTAWLCPVLQTFSKVISEFFHELSVWIYPYCVYYPVWLSSFGFFPCLLVELLWTKLNILALQGHTDWHTTIPLLPRTVMQMQVTRMWTCITVLRICKMIGRWSICMMRSSRRKGRVSWLDVGVWTHHRNRSFMQFNLILTPRAGN